MDRNALDFLLNTSPSFSLEEMYKRTPETMAENLHGMMIEHNKSQIPDKKLYGPDKYYRPGINGSRDLQQTWDGLQNTNGSDTIRYFHPETNLRMTDMEPRTLGFVDRKVPNVVNMSSYWGSEDPVSKRTNTLLHEATHVDDNLRKDNKLNIFGEIPGFNYEQLVRKLPPDVKKDHFTASNSEESYREMRANLRASLGSAPKGTSEEDHFKAILDAQNGWTNPIDYYPTEAQGMFDKVKLRSREEILKGMMNDMFPRERWLEPREPTWRESMDDKIQAIKKYLFK